MVVSAAVPAAARDDTWRSKLGEDLKHWLNVHVDAETVELILWGGELPVPETPFETRAEWWTHFEDSSRFFIDQVGAVTLQSGGEILAKFPVGNGIKVRVPVAALESLASIPAVKVVGIDGVTEVQLIKPLPGMDEGPEGQLAQSVAMTQAPDLWAAGFKGDNIVVAVIDTGIDHDHPDFMSGGKSRVVGWKDVTNTAGCGTPCDGNGHGTHVASTVGASKDAGGSYFGVAPHVKFFGIKIFPGSSSGGSWEQAIAGLEEVLKHPSIDINTNSWGGGCSGGGLTARTTAENLVRAGVETIFAAGNSGFGGIICPGDGNLVVTVGAVDKSFVVAGFSSRGPCQGGRICPDIMAPGVNIVAARTGGGYTSLSGTSMATPHVAGATALLEQAMREIGGRGLDAASQEIEFILKTTARDLGAIGPDNNYGWGHIRTNDAYGFMIGFALLNPSVSFSIDKTELRNGQSFGFTFGSGVAGSVAADFDGAVTLYDTPTGRVLGTLSGHFAPGSDAKMTGSGSVGGLDPGEYSVNGRTSFSFTHPSSGKVVKLSLGKDAKFTLRGVKMTGSVVAPAKAEAGKENSVTARATNVGNEAASKVTVEATIPSGLVLHPHVVPGYVTGKTPKKVISDPEPSDARPNADGSLTLIWSNMTLAAGASFQPKFSVNTHKAGSYAFVVSGSYVDQAGDSGTFSGTTVVTFGAGKVPQAPTPPAPPQVPPTPAIPPDLPPLPAP